MNSAFFSHDFQQKKGWPIFIFVVALHGAFFWSVLVSQSQPLKRTIASAQPLTVRWVTPEPETVQPVEPMPVPAQEIESEPELLPPPKVETPSPVKIKPKPPEKKKNKLVKKIQKQEVVKQPPKQEKEVIEPAVVTKKESLPTASPVAPTIEQPKFNAAYLSNPAPVYPRRSRMLEEEGVAKVKVHVSVEGKPLSVSLQQSSGFSRLDDAAITAVERWRFVPAKRGNQSIEGWVIVPVSFKLRS